MAEETTTLKHTHLRLSAVDILKNIAAALVIALLLYWSPILADRLFFTPVEVGYHRVSLFGRTGYIFTVDNNSGKVLDNATIYIDSPFEVIATSQDGASKFDVRKTPASISLRLSEIPPNKRANIFVETSNQLAPQQVRVSSSATITTLQSHERVERALWDAGTLLYALAIALFYFWFLIVVTAQRNRLRAEVDAVKRSLGDARDDVSKSRDELDQKQEEMNKEIDDIRLRQVRVQMYLQRRITELDKEASMWRQFFKKLYSTIFSEKNDAERAMELLLSASGARLIKKLGDYNESELIEILEANAANKGKPQQP